MVCVCGCGAQYTREAWTLLRLCGYVEITPDEDEPGGIRELRDCLRCRSTISVRVEPEAVDARAPYARI